MIDSDTIELIEEYLTMTNNIHEAIWMIGDDILIDGVWDMGIRSEDHRCIEVLSDKSRYDEEDFWNEIHLKFNAIRLVPETMIALIVTDQEVTEKQYQLLNEGGYKVAKY